MKRKNSSINVGIDEANEQDRRIWSGVLVGSAIALAATILTLTTTANNPEVPAPVTTSLKLGE